MDYGVRLINEEDLLLKMDDRKKENYFRWKEGSKEINFMFNLGIPELGRVTTWTGIPIAQKIGSSSYNEVTFIQDGYIYQDYRVSARRLQPVHLFIYGKTKADLSDRELVDKIQKECGEEWEIWNKSENGTVTLMTEKKVALGDPRTELRQGCVAYNEDGAGWVPQDIASWRRHPAMADVINRITNGMDMIFERDIDRNDKQVQVLNEVRTTMHDFKVEKKEAEPVEVSPRDVVKQVYDTNKGIIDKASGHEDQALLLYDAQRWFSEELTRNGLNFSEMSLVDKMDYAALTFAKAYRGVEIRIPGGNKTVKMYGKEIVIGVARNF